jgi:hypothetical protein
VQEAVVEEYGLIAHAVLSVNEFLAALDRSREAVTA